MSNHANTVHCDYCDEYGHDYRVHPEARADVAAWQRQAHAEEFPFGDYRGH